MLIRNKFSYWDTFTYIPAHLVEVCTFGYVTLWHWRPERSRCDCISSILCLLNDFVVIATCGYFTTNLLMRYLRTEKVYIDMENTRINGTTDQVYVSSVYGDTQVKLGEE